LLAAVAEDVVFEAAHGGLRGLLKFFTDSAKHPLPIPSAHRSTLDMLIEARNVCTHQRGIPNAVQLTNLTALELKPGERIHTALTWKAQIEHGMAFHESAKAIDIAAVEEWGVPAVAAH
jgi:hypothetical protein